MEELMVLLNMFKEIIVFLSEAFELYYMDERSGNTYKSLESTYEYKKYL